MDRTTQRTSFRGLAAVAVCAAWVAAEPIRFHIRDHAEPCYRDVDGTVERLGGSIELASALLQPPLEPVLPTSPDAGVDLPVPPATESFSRFVFGSRDVRRSLLSQSRVSRVSDIAVEFVFGTEGKFRATTDGGSLLGKSIFSPSVRTQQRTPIITDPRVRSDRYARLLAAGSYWAPARMDLDTLLSKVDSRILRDVMVIKGPYSTLYGPGFDFVDFQFHPTPRYDDGYHSQGLSSIEYQTNGEQWYGRQAFWGGGVDWGFRVGYGHRTGSDYDTGHAADGSFFEPQSLPTSYNSRMVDFAIGHDIDPSRHLEFTYLRLDQTDVEFPGLVFDINALKTDGYELNYTVEDQPHFDRMTAEAWYNRTAFHGDTSRAGKNTQIPFLPDQLQVGTDQFLITDVDGMASGYRFAFTWGDHCGGQTIAGTDYIRQSTQLNDIRPEFVEILPLPPPLDRLIVPRRNDPIPRSHSDDMGFFLEHSYPVDPCLLFKCGGRLDFVETNADNSAPLLGELAGFPLQLNEMTLSELKQAGLKQHFTPVSFFATAERQLNRCWSISAAAGYAIRPPNLTELYAAGPFLGVLQPGLSIVEGDPELDPERLTQIDLGLRGSFPFHRFQVNAFHAWIHDYIVFDDFGVVRSQFTPGEDFQILFFGNTDLATLTGFEFTSECNLTSWLTGFLVSSFVSGRDRSRSGPARLAALERTGDGFLAGPRSLVSDPDAEPLPNIPPLEARLGVRLHEPGPTSNWGIELEARIVDGQDRVAASLFEQPTPGFTVWNLRSFWQATDRLLVIAGVENFSDRFYREHLDYRSGRGVFRPGISFYTSGEITY